ncbi:hypothetical protein IAT38_001867 [Cryptococcus sp. DSM 104549]
MQQPKQEDNADQPRRKLGKVDRGREACNECRRHKIRCHPHPDDPQHLFPCSRCERMNIGCEFAKHNRGRKRKRPLPLLSGEPPAEGSSSSQANGHAQSSTQAHDPVAQPPGPPHSFGDPRFPFISTDPAHGPSASAARPRHYDEYRHSGGHGGQISLRRMVGEESEDEGSSGGDEEGEYPDGGEGGREDGEGGEPPRRKAKMAMRGSDLVDDPVRAGFVDEAEARSLFHLFMMHMNSSLPMLDPSFHTHDYVREKSSFLYTAILCIMSRYLSSLSPANASEAGHISPESARSVHQQILVLARDHLTWSFAEGITSIDAVRAMVVLSLHKEPDDEKAGYYVSRAVLMGKELNLGRIPPKEEMDKLDEDEMRCLRSRQRVWLCLFFVNSIFNMQFRQPMLILQSDPLVSTAHHWLKRSRADTLLRDTQLVCSTELRRKFLHYRDLLVGSGPDEPAYRSALSLSLLTRTMNQDWDVTSEAWIRDIIDVGGTSSHVNKPRIWTSALRLNLNLLIVNQTLRLPPQDQIDTGDTSSIPAFHHCLNAATTVLVRFEGLDRQQLTFASDTFLHFALYASTLLSTLCRGQHPYKFESIEIEHCRRLILKAADTLESASAYTHDSPALHAYYLRRLIEILPPPAPPTPSHGHGHGGLMRSPLIPQGGQGQVGHGHGGHPGHQAPPGQPQPAPPAPLPIDPTLTLPTAPTPSTSHPASTLPLNTALTNALGNELDFLMVDFPWMGFEPQMGGGVGWGAGLVGVGMGVGVGGGGETGVGVGGGGGEGWGDGGGGSGGFGV